MGTQTLLLTTSYTLSVRFPNFESPRSAKPGKMPKLIAVASLVLATLVVRAQQDLPAQQMTEIGQGFLQPTVGNLNTFDDEQPRSVTPELLKLTPAAYQSHPEFGIRPFNAQCSDCIELIHKRTPNSRYYVKPGTGGSVFYVQQSYGQLHYADSDGRLITIDSRLRPHPEKFGIFYAPYQELPITIDLDKDSGYTSMLLENGFELKYNRDIRIHGSAPRATLDWTGNHLGTYTAGKDGVLNQSFMPFIDREIKTGHGEIKTSFILQRPFLDLHSTEGYISIEEFISLPPGYMMEYSDGIESNDGWWYGELSLTDKFGKELARWGRPLVYDDSMQSFDETDIPVGYRIQRTDRGVWLEVHVALRWLNDPSRVYPVTIDPLVTGTNTYTAGTIGFNSDPACWNPGNYCAATMSVTVPGMSTLVNANFSAQYTSLANGCAPGVNCLMNQAAFRLYGPCGFSPGSNLYWTCLPPCASPGTVTGSGLPMFPVVSCLPPQCPDFVLSFEMRTYHCSCTTPACATTCHFMPNNSWSVTIEGRTVESTASVAPPIICQGQSTTITGSGSYGVPPYSYSWMPGGLIGATQTVSPSTTTTYTLTVTDACNNTSTSTVLVTVRPTPVLTLSHTNVLCYGQNTGTATVSATGGSTFTYNWNSTPPQNTATANNLPAGTYTVTVTNNFGCSATGSVTITQPASAVSASITASTNVSCFGGNDGSASAAASGGTPGYTYAWNTVPPQSTSTATNLPAGTFTVTVTDANGCLQTASVSISQPMDLAVSTSGTNPSCNGTSNGSASASASGGTPGYTYLWNTVPPQSGSTASGLAAGSYTVIATDTEGCTETATVTLTNPPTIALSTSSTNASCATSADGSGTVIASGGTPGYTYLWNTTPPQSTATATALNPGTYSVTVTDANNCQQSASVTVGMNAGMTLSTSTVSVSCFGGSNGSATVSVSGGTGPYSYAWSTTPTQTTATANSLAAGTYTVTVTDANGCQQTTSATVSQPAAVTPTFSKTDVTCNGGSDGTATVSPSGGTPPYTFAWNTTPVQTTATATGLPAGSWSVTVTDANGCLSNGSITILQPPVMSVSITHTDPSCNGGNDGTATASPINGSGPFTFVWNTTPPQITATATNLSAGTYSVTITDATGCTANGSVTLGQPNALFASVVTTDASCNGSADGAATVSASGGTAPYTYGWNTTPVQTTATALNLTAGTWTVTVTDNVGCTFIAQGTVMEPPPINVAISSVDVSCNGAADGQATATPSGGSSPYTYVWNTTPPQVTSTVSGIGGGTYTVTVTDATGCTGNASVTINEPTALSATTSSVPESCTGIGNGQASVSASGGTPPYTYLWNTIPPQTTTTANGLVSGNYSVTVTDDNGCIVTASVSVTALNTLSASATATDASCYGLSDGSIDLQVSGGATPYAFQWSNAMSIEDPAGVPAGNYSVTVTDDDGCTVTTSVTVSQPAQITVDAGIDRTIEQGDSVNLVAVVAPPGSYSYLWQPPTGLDDPFGASVIATPVSTTIYTVTVTDLSGCSVSDQVRIEVLPPAGLELPTAFSPNGDGLNDVFFDPLPLGVEIVEMNIFNRWGDRIHSGQQPWDGTFNGIRQPIGTYAYSVTVNFPGTPYVMPFTGNVTLIR